MLLLSNWYGKPCFLHPQLHVYLVASVGAASSDAGAPPLALGLRNPVSQRKLRQVKVQHSLSRLHDDPSWPHCQQAPHATLRSRHYTSQHFGLTLWPKIVVLLPKASQRLDLKLSPQCFNSLTRLMLRLRKLVAQGKKRFWCRFHAGMVRFRRILTSMQCWFCPFHSYLISVMLWDYPRTCEWVGGSSVTM